MLLSLILTKGVLICLFRNLAKFYQNRLTTEQSRRWLPTPCARSIELQRGKKLKAENIAKQWWVNEKTARRDIASLVEYGVIRYHGARKNGFYTVT
jgi:Fic family protein